MTIPQRNLIIGSLLVVGLGLVLAAWLLEGSDFVPALLLEMGAGLFLFAVLFVIEARLTRRLDEITKDIESPQTTLEDLRSLSRDLVSDQYAAVTKLLEKWETDLSHLSVWSLLNTAQNAKAISEDGVRVYLPGPAYDSWMTLKANGSPDHPRVLFRVENLHRELDAHYEWHPSQSPEDAVIGLFEAVRNSRVEWSAFDAAWILEQALTPIRIGLEAVYRAPRRNWELEYVVEVPDSQWAITKRGLECTTHHYPIDWWRLWEGWIGHMERKDWVDIHEFTTALVHAQAYFEQRRSEASTARAAHNPPTTDDEEDWQDH